MLEVIGSVGLVVAFALLSTAWHHLTPLELLAAGAALTVAGTVLSLVGGLGYHGALWRTLGRRGALPRGWFWRPTALHGRLRAGERACVLPWFVLGAAGFVTVVAGGLLVLVAAQRGG